MAPRSVLMAAALAVSALSPPALAAGGPLGIDHRLTYDNSGIWKRSYQKDLAAGAGLTVIGGALFGNSESRLGRTFDQALDSIVLSVATAGVMKVTFTRERPRDTADPDRFFQGGSNDSFPSGEVAEITGIVTPFIAEYGHDHPAVYALALLPAYDAVARVKVQGHWQSDVLVGAGVGVAWGLYAHHRKSPLIMGLLPGHGLLVGYSRRF